MNTGTQAGTQGTQERTDRHAEYNAENPGGKRFVFTFWHDKISPDAFRERLLALPGVRYMVLAHELGEDTQKPHFQGYMVLAQKTRIKAVKALLMPDAEFPTMESCPGKVMIARGTHEEARDYCKHEGKHKDKPGLVAVWEAGSQDGLGEDRSPEEGQFSACVRLIREGCPLSEVVSRFPGVAVRYYRNLEGISALYAPVSCLVAKRMSEGAR